MTIKKSETEQIYKLSKAPDNYFPHFISGLFLVWSIEHLCLCHLCHNFTERIPVKFFKQPYINQDCIRLPQICKLTVMRCTKFLDLSLKLGCSSAYWIFVKLDLYERYDINKIQLSHRCHYGYKNKPDLTYRLTTSFYAFHHCYNVP